MRPWLLGVAFATFAISVPGQAVEILGAEHVIAMSDGVRLYATVGRPDRPEPVPVMMTGSPYGGGAVTGFVTEA